MRKFIILILVAVLNLSPIVRDTRVNQTDSFDGSEYLYYKSTKTEAKIPFGFYEPQLIDSHEQLKSILEPMQKTLMVEEDFFDYNYIIAISYKETDFGLVGYRGVEVIDGECVLTVETVSLRKAYLENGEIHFEKPLKSNNQIKCDFVYVFKTENNSPEQFDEISINQIHHRAIKRHYE